MGEWPAWHPTVSLRCHSTDVTNGFGSGTSRRCGAESFSATSWLRHRRSCWLRHLCSERRRARPPSARRASLGASARSPARPCRPVGALHTGGAWCALHVTRPGPLRPQLLRCLIAAPAINVACNSPATISNHEIAALELQRFEALLNLRPIELHATFVWSGPVVCRETTTCEYLHSAQSVCTAAP